MEKPTATVEENERNKENTRVNCCLLYSKVAHIAEIFRPYFKR